MSLEDLAALGFFRFSRLDLAATRRRVAAGESLHNIEGLGRFGFADAESLSEGGLALGLERAASLLRARGIGCYSVTSPQPGAKHAGRIFDVYVALPDGWVIAEHELESFTPDGECWTYNDDDVLRMGSRRFSRGGTGEEGEAWRAASRAFCRILDCLLEAHGCEDRAFSIWPGANDHHVLLGTPEMADMLEPILSRPIERWPELREHPSLHDFVNDDPEFTVSGSHLCDVARMQVAKSETDEHILRSVASEERWHRYADDRIHVGPLPRFDRNTFEALGVSELPLDVPRDAEGQPFGHVLVEARDRSHAEALVRSLHNLTIDGARVIAQAAPIVRARAAR